MVLVVLWLLVVAVAVLLLALVMLVVVLAVVSLSVLLLALPGFVVALALVATVVLSVLHRTSSAPSAADEPLGTDGGNPEIASRAAVVIADARDVLWINTPLS